MRLSEADRLALERANAAESLIEYVELAWPAIDPQPLERSWHMEAICEHLEACSNGEIRQLIINVPPGTSKSMTTAVMWPSWLMGPAGKPGTRFIGASYESGLAIRDNRRTRDLMNSDWYQERWPTDFLYSKDTYFETRQRGFRQAVAVASMTGKRGDIVVWDDPLSPELANSEPERNTAIRILTETLPNRFTNSKTSVFVLIMQRLHQMDPTGYIIEQELGYEHLMLPMEFEPERKCYTSIGFEDPRTEDGELLDPVRFPQEEVDRLKKTMREYGYAGQNQQRPVPRAGGLMKREDFKFLPAVPPGTRFVRGWDFAGTDSTKADFSANALVGECPDGRIIVADVRRKQASPRGVRMMLKSTAAEDRANWGFKCKGSIPQDPGQAGKAQVEQMIANELKGFSYSASTESGDKITRIEPFAAQVEIGNVYLIEGDWNTTYMDEMCIFPGGKNDDQVDATSRAFMVLMEPRTTPSMALSKGRG